MKRRNSRLLLIAGILVGAVVGSYYSISSEETSTSRKPPRSFLKSQAEPSALEKAYQRPAGLELSAPVLDEATRSARLEEDPELAERRLDELARSLPVTELRKMKDIVIQPSRDGDLRATSVELLARSQHEEVVGLLEETLTSDWEASPDLRLNQFEQALRARALEGLQNHPSPQADRSLQQALNKLEDPFLKDRAQRALLHRKGHVPSVEDQDEAALKKILDI